MRIFLLLGMVASSSVLASNVVSTYGFTDSTSAPLAKTSAFTLDARVSPWLTGMASNVALFTGLTRHLEFGVGGSMLVEYARGVTGGWVSPWLKAGFDFGTMNHLSLLAGSTLDLSRTTASTAGAELVFTRDFSWGTVDTNVGFSLRVDSALLTGHLSVTSYINVYRSLFAVVEAFGYVGGTTPSLGQRVGLGFMGIEQLTADVSIAMLESPAPLWAVTFAPQIGLTSTF